MIRYAISMSSIGPDLSEEWIQAFRNARIKNIEVIVGSFLESSEHAQANLELFRRMLDENVVRVESTHLPFAPSEKWEISLPEESCRKAVIDNIRRVADRYPFLFRRNLTVHSSLEPIRDEERQLRIRQACRSIEELLPLTEKLGLSLNVEYLPRTCIGNREEDLLEITSKFKPEEVGICMDVNHVMSRHAELPQIIETLSPRIRTFHLSDYDGVDERHWYIGQGLIDWCAVMQKIRAIDHDVLLIFETRCTLQGGEWGRPLCHPSFAIRQAERDAFHLENCESLQPAFETFRVPGN